MFTRPAVGVCAALFALAPFVAHSVRSDAQGVLRINGKEIPLKYAYAVAEVPELAMPDNGKDGYDLIITDKPVTDAELDCRTLLQYRARGGGLSGLILSFDPAKSGPHNGHLLYQDKAIFFSILGDSEEHKFAAKTYTRDAIVGRLWMPSEKETDVTGSPLKMVYDVNVDASVRRPPAVTATLTGAAAAKSPQARALFGFCRGARSGDLAGVKQVAVPEQTTLFDGPDGKQFFGMMRQAMPDPARIRVVMVIVRGNLAVVQAKAPPPLGDATMKCFLRKGVWRVSLN